MFIAIRLINIAVSLLTLVVFVYSLLGFFLSPYHPVRETLAMFVEPMLVPIRRVLPPTVGIDFSPLILIILIQVLGSILIAILRSFS
jgi:YggT family protein